MTPGIGFALAAMLCFGLGDLIYKRAASIGSPSRQFVMMLAWVYCRAVTIYAWVAGTLHSNMAS